MNIIFRVDASNQIGTGHIIRCVTLAKRLKRKGAQCTFICKENKGNLFGYVLENGFELKVLKKQKNSNIDEKFKKKFSHSDWLGSSQSDDAEQTIRLLEGETPDWLVIDHYGIDHRWQELLRRHCKKILVIDDLADRKHDCDLLLDQNLVKDYLNRYENLVAPLVPKLLGPKFALLQEEYSEVKNKVPLERNEVKTIIVYFGGSDLYSLTESVVDTLVKTISTNVKVEVVSSNPSASLIDKMHKNKNFNIHSNLPSLAPLMLKADLAIGAGGTTTWERCFMGLPSIVVATADNQVATSKEMHEQGMIYWLGHAKDINKEDLSSKVKEILSDYRFFSASSKICMNLLDGLGADRVAQIMLLNQSTKLVARSVTMDDEKLLLELRNEPEVRSNSLSTEIIDSKSHSLWFNGILSSPEIHDLFVIETVVGLPIGQVRFDLEDNNWIISYSLAPFARGKKLSKKILRLALREFYRDNPTKTVIGAVKSANQTSQQILNDLGFTMTNTDGGGDIYRYLLKPGRLVF